MQRVVVRDAVALHEMLKIAGRHPDWIGMPGSGLTKWEDGFG